MSLIRGIHSGAKTLLAHFHYVCKGRKPFDPDIDLDSVQIRQMIGLDDTQLAAIKRIKAIANRSGSIHLTRPNVGKAH